MGKGKGEMGAMVTHFTDLHAWKIAHELTLFIYKISKKFPDDEKFGLTSQLRRASVSIESNIAEGFGRFGANDKKQFYLFAKSSCLEVECQIRIIKDLEYCNEESYKSGLDLCLKAQQALSGLIQSMRARR